MYYDVLENDLTSKMLLVLIPQVNFVCVLSKKSRDYENKIQIQNV